MSTEAMEVRDAAASYKPQTVEQDVPPGYKRTEVGVIPEGWSVLPLGELTSFVSSGKSAINGNSGEFPLYGSTGIIGSSDCCDYEGDAILVARVGANAGKLNLVTGKYGVSDNTIIIRFGKNSDIHFFLYLLKNRNLNNLIFGSGQPLITGAQLKSLQVVNPPGKEQRAIATALSDVDALITALDKLIAKKRAIKTAAMQQLLTGKQRLPGFSGEWEVKRLGEICKIRKERVDPRRVRGQQFCVELEHIGQGTGKLLGDTSAGPEASLKAVFHPGDVLFGKLRAYLRKYWFADRVGVCSTEIWPLIADEEQLKPEYLYQLVTTDDFIKQASEAYGTHMPRSDWKIVKEISVQLPSKEEQTAIAQVLSDMDAEIAALEARRDKTRAIKQGMMQELLTGRVRLVKPDDRKAA